MKPLTLKVAPRILGEGRSILLLNKSLLNLNTFVQWLMRRANNVSTKRKKLTLPLKIWAIILEFATTAVMTETPRREQNAYVQAVDIEHRLWEPKGDPNSVDSLATYLRCQHVNAPNVRSLPSWDTSMIQSHIEESLERFMSWSFVCNFDTALFWSRRYNPWMARARNIAFS
ncbi:hypothetical protein VTO42DRAFT_1343 [Malbranchea cinnamomea]